MYINRIVYIYLDRLRWVVHSIPPDTEYSECIRYTHAVTGNKPTHFIMNKDKKIFDGTVVQLRNFVVDEYEDRMRMIDIMGFINEY
ncbi:MAG: hypothetical protein HOK52_07375 [Candidatus Marinimicrobia bacterium]|jgi:hypothetical protein|nr:hypothetical protein [Candidatus Woesearchaeota archaeon]MBT6471063.1 hypothetical protein [Candidatus Neomarinimicrobiota bacterium]